MSGKKMKLNLFGEIKRMKVFFNDNRGVKNNENEVKNEITPHFTDYNCFIYCLWG